MITNTITLIPALYAQYINTKPGAKLNSLYVFIIWLILFIFWLINATNLIDVLPLIGSSIYTISLFQRKPNSIRKLLIANKLVWVIYDLIVGLFSGALFGTFIIISTAIALYRYRKKPKKSRKNKAPIHHHLYRR